MLTLIRKDLLLHKTAFYGYVPVLVVYMGYLASQIDSRNTFITFTCIVAAVLPIVMIAREDKFGAEAFVCSLPATRRQVVHAKYVLSWAVALVLILIGLSLYSMLATEGRSGAWTLSTASRVLLTLSLGLGVALPVALRYGWIGLTAGLVVMPVLGLVTLIILKNYSIDLQIKETFIASSEFIDRVHSQLGGLTFLAGVLVILIIFNVASCRISVALFERREF